MKQSKLPIAKQDQFTKETNVIIQSVEDEMLNLLQCQGKQNFGAYRSCTKLFGGDLL